MHTSEQEITKIRKEIRGKLTNDLLELMILKVLEEQPMCSYKIMEKISETYGVRLKPSSIYSLLNASEKRSYLAGQWSMESGKPMRVYQLTSQGKRLLQLTERSLELICETVSRDTAKTVEVSTM